MMPVQFVFLTAYVFCVGYCKTLHWSKNPEGRWGRVIVQ